MNESEFMRNQGRQLVEAAEEVLKKAYAPYSQFQVGAAVLTKQGNIFTGCNVENASYGLCICAERNAIASAVTTEGGDLEIVAIAIENNRQIPFAPCGACRQVIQEFGENAVVVHRSHKTWWQTSSIKSLLPQGFFFQP